jgi:uncharacterized protein YecE (DUF72 family)
MGTIAVGTSGYSYNEWVGTVYPEGTKPKDYLGCYAKLFSTVELNFSYYAMPKAENLSKLLEDGPGVSFSIKAHRTLTHDIDAYKWQDEAKTYLAAMEPMLQAGRLEAILFQFPYSFHYTADNRRYLDKLLSFFKGVPQAVEFRTADWFSGKVIDGMRERGVPLVSLDMPQLPKLPPLMDVVTSPLAYIRMHGRNQDAWWGSSSWEQYNYLYSDEELESWGARIERIVRQAQRVLVYFNNHPLGKAARNANTLIKILTRINIIPKI